MTACSWHEPPVEKDAIIMEPGRPFVHDAAGEDGRKRPRRPAARKEAENTEKQGRSRGTAGPSLLFGPDAP